MGSSPGDFYSSDLLLKKGRATQVLRISVRGMTKKLARLNRRPEKNLIEIKLDYFWVASCFNETNQL